MGYTIPEGVDTMLDVVGVGWPNVDEDAYRDMADALREFATDADDDAGAAHGHIQRLLSTGQSESLTALDAHWKKVQGKNKDLAGAARIIAGALDRVADIIVARKIAAVGELADLCATVGIALAAAPFTMGLTTLLAGGKIVATRIAFKKILKEMAEAAVAEITATLTQPAVAALESIVTDLAIQTAMDVTGADGSTQINSAGGGGSGGPGGTLGIDHDAHGSTGSRLANVQVSMDGRAKGKIDKAKGHHGRAKGKDSLTAVLDGTIEGVVEKLIKGHKHLGDHVGKKLPDALGQSSKTHKNTDKDVDDRLKKITGSGKRDTDDLTGKRTNPSDPARKHPDDVSTNPNRARRAFDDADGDRKHSDGPNQDKDRDKTDDGTDPIDLATGRMYLPQTDVLLPGALPLEFSRRVESGYRFGRFFGPSWSSTVDERLEVDAEGVVHVLPDGRLRTYPHPTPGAPALPAVGSDLTELVRTESGDYALTDPVTGLVHHFAAPLVPGGDGNGGGDAWLVQVSDRNGNTVSVDRADDGTPLGLAHSGGYRLALTVAEGRVTALDLVTAQGDLRRIRTYGYEDGNLTAVTKPSGAVLAFGYDERRRVTSWTDSNGRRYDYAYDERDRCIAEGGEAGHIALRLAYGERDPQTGHRTTTLTTADGAVTRHLIGRGNRILATTDPLGNTTRHTYDVRGNLLTTTDPLDRTTAYIYDGQGRLEVGVRPDGTEVRLVRDESGQPVEVVRPDGTRLRGEFDARGNQVALTDGAGHTTRYDYDDRGRLTSVTDPAGAVTGMRCDAAGLPVEVRDPLGGTTRYERDAFGRPVRVVDPLGGVESFEWTADGHLARRTAPDGASESWTYDGEGNCTTHTDAMGAVTRFEYTHFDLLAARTDPDGTRYAFEHDAALRLTRVTNPAGLTWSYVYDRAGRLASETDFDGRTLAYARDAAGQVVARTNALDETVAYERDRLGRVVRKDAAGAVTTYAYDRAGRLAQAAGPDTELVHQYDRRGLLKTELVDGRATTYAYDALGRRTRRVTPTGRRTTYEYDAAGRRTRLTSGGHRIDFAHDELGREVERSVGDVLRITSTWDAAGRLATQQLTAHAGSINHRAYTYRADGRLTALDDALRGPMRFDLDGAGRVTSVTARNWTESYAYDATGNQTEASWPDRHAGHEATGPRAYSGTTITRAGAVRYEHDALGRITLRQKPRLSRKPDTWRYEWDAEDRLTAVTTPDGARWRYRYDPLGRRIAKQRLADDGATVLEETRFTWDATTLCEQVTHSPDLPHPVALTWDHQGLRPLSQSERRLSADASQTEVDERFFAIATDLVGTPTELIDESGELAWHTRATLWGTTTWARTSTGYTPLRFPGQYFDLETGLHYNYFRHYDPESARYVTPDPLGLAPAPNPVSYVPNPLREIDPFGLSPYKVLYHGTRNWQGDEFSLDTSTSEKREYTPNAGVYMTDDFNRAATQYAGPDGVIVRAEVPSDVAERALRLHEGPAGNLPEYFFNTPEGVAHLNANLRVLPQRDAILQHLMGNF
ncbi:RHS repeat-associated core domain-containing protein [Streptomyces sp. NPDC048057]|uniref:RHS repeat-associated core domain-containing protein n=1 Tax=Streptomyces sp. NPDC048057 TaxID=3155628 RepID=UPI0033DF79C2